MSRPIPEGWEETKIGKHITEVKERNGHHTDVPVLSVTNSQGFVHSEEYFDRKVYSKNLENYKLVRYGQFAYNPSRLNVGSLARLTDFEMGLLSPMYIVFEAGKTLNPEFLAYWLTSEKVKSLIKASTQGTVRDSVIFSALASFTILLPSLPEQQKIAEILGSVDAAIEATQAVITQTRRTQKMLMEELLTKGLPGQGTQHWKPVLVDDVLVRIDAGKSPNCEGRPASRDEWGVLKVSAVSWEEFNPQENKALPKSFSPVSEMEVQAGDLLISRANTVDLVGAVVLVNETRSKLMLCDKTLRLVPKENILKEYLLIVLRSKQAREWIESEATGTSKSMKNISQKTIRDVKFLLPPVSEQRIISDTYQAFQKGLAQLKTRESILLHLKSALMQMLLTGEKRVCLKQPEEVAV